MTFRISRYRASDTGCIVLHDNCAALNSLSGLVQDYPRPKSRRQRPPAPAAEPWHRKPTACSQRIHDTSAIAKPCIAGCLPTEFSNEFSLGSEVVNGMSALLKFCDKGHCTMPPGARDVPCQTKNRTEAGLLDRDLNRIRGDARGAELYVDIAFSGEP